MWQGILQEASCHRFSHPLSPCVRFLKWCLDLGASGVQFSHPYNMRAILNDKTSNLVGDFTRSLLLSLLSPTLPLRKVFNESRQNLANELTIVLTDVIYFKETQTKELKQRQKKVFTGLSYGFVTQVKNLTINIILYNLHTVVNI